MTDALAALYTGVTTRLDGAGPWGVNVFARLAPAGTARPYVIFAWAGGGDLNRLVRKSDPEYLLRVKVVSDKMDEAMDCCALLVGLLDDAGQYDTASPISGGSGWHILTTTAELRISTEEFIDGNRVYHEGFNLRCKMEAV